MRPQVEVVGIGAQILDILREADVVGSAGRETEVGERGELLGTDELCVVVGTVLEGAANVVLGLEQARLDWLLRCRVLEECLEGDETTGAAIATACQPYSHSKPRVKSEAGLLSRCTHPAPITATLMTAIVHCKGAC